MNFKWGILIVIVFIFMGLQTHAQLKSVIYDFEGLSDQQVTVPDGFYKYGDLNYQVVSIEDGGMLGFRCLKCSLNKQNGYAGLGRGITRFIELDKSKDHLNFYIKTDIAIAFDLSITEDDNDDASFADVQDDKWQRTVSINASASWQLISLPLSGFSDANTGGNGIFDIAYTGNGGRLLNIELRFNTNAILGTQNFYLDMICFSEGALPTGSSVIERPLKQSGDYCLLGAYGANSQKSADLVPAEFEQLFSAQKKIKYVNTFLAFSNTGTSPNNYPGPDVERLLQNGYTPIITIEPFYSQLAPLDPAQPKLSEIINGQYDSYFNALAQKVKTYSDTVYIRPMHEFDGNWYPWCISTNGGDPNLFKNAYKHIVDRFRANSVSNVKWLWCPNAYPTPNASYNWFVFAYPGDDYIDIVGTNIYNHPNAGNPTWRSFRYLLAESYYYLQKNFAGKPFFIFEVASRERNQDEDLGAEGKAGWIKEMDNELQSNFHKVRALIWFNVPKEHDWRLNSSTASTTAFEQAIWNDPYYFGEGASVVGTDKNLNFLMGANPSNGSLRISLYSLTGYSVTVYNTLGERIIESNNNHYPFQADLSGLASGVFLVEVNEGNNRAVQKLVLQKD